MYLSLHKYRSERINLTSNQLKETFTLLYMNYIYVEIFVMWLVIVVLLLYIFVVPVSEKLVVVCHADITEEIAGKLTIHFNSNFKPNGCFALLLLTKQQELLFSLFFGDIQCPVNENFSVEVVQTGNVEKTQSQNAVQLYNIVNPELW